MCSALVSLSRGDTRRFYSRSLGRTRTSIYRQEAPGGGGTGTSAKVIPYGRRRTAGARARIGEEKLKIDSSGRKNVVCYWVGRWDATMPRIDVCARGAALGWKRHLFRGGRIVRDCGRGAPEWAVTLELFFWVGKFCFSDWNRSDWIRARSRLYTGHVLRPMRGWNTKSDARLAWYWHVMHYTVDLIRGEVRYRWGFVRIVEFE